MAARVNASLAIHNGPGGPMLHRIWLGFFLIAFVSSLYQWLGLGDAEVFQRMVGALFEMAGLSVELAIGLKNILN